MKPLTYCVAVVACLALVSNASAVIVFQDDFETAPAVSSAAYPDPSGDYDPVAQVGSWEITGRNLEAEVDQMIQVTDYETPGAHGGSNYLRTAFASDQAYAYGLFDGGATTMDLTISTWFYAKSNVFRDGRLFLYDENRTYAVFVRMGEDGTAGGIAGQVQMYDGGSWVNSTIDGGYTADAWHHLEVSTDWVNRAYSVSLDGAMLGTGLAMRAEATNMAMINLNGWNGELDPPPSFDDVIVHVIPEPMTCGLLSIGLLSLVAVCRSRRS